MNITKEQYEAAKKIVEGYERNSYEEEMLMVEDDLEEYSDDEDEHDPLEDEYINCKCGAYVLGKHGGILKLSDCYC